jgi:hypothetical protein
MFKFISHANQYLLFVAGLLAIVTVSHILIVEVFSSNNYEHPKVEVISVENKVGDSAEVKYSKEYLTKIRDVHILNIRTDRIQTDNQEENIGQVVEMFSGGSAYDNFSSVNLMFTIEEQNNYLLFKHDKLIHQRMLANFKNENSSFGRDYLLHKNLYLVTDTDSNNDGYLSMDDERNLYLSDYNGKNLQLIKEGVTRFNMINHHQILLQKGSYEQKVFYILNTESKELKELNTVMTQRAE